MKKFYKENRVFVILMIIVVICLVVMGMFLLSYFYKGNNKNKYGNRLDGINSVALKDGNIADIINKIKANESVEDVSINVYGKIIYISISVKDSTSLETGKGISIKSLENFSDQYIKYYDFQFLLKENKEDGFVILGAKNKSNSNVIWNNNKDSEA